MSPAPKPQRPQPSSGMHESRTLAAEVEPLSIGGTQPAAAPIRRSEQSDKPAPFGSYLPPDLKRAFKARCVERDVEMQDALAEALRDWLTKTEAD